jgi:nitrate reductase cytochrome c-type subunit
LSGWKLTRNLLLVLAVTLVMTGIGLVVSRGGAPGGQVRATVAVDRYGCLACHNNPDYEPGTSSRPWREFSVDEAILASSTHRTIECADCHTTFDTG